MKWQLWCFSEMWWQCASVYVIFIFFMVLCAPSIWRCIPFISVKFYYIISLLLPLPFSLIFLSLSLVSWVLGFLFLSSNLLKLEVKLKMEKATLYFNIFKFTPNWKVCIGASFPVWIMRWVRRFWEFFLNSFFHFCGWKNKHFGGFV